MLASGNGDPLVCVKNLIRTVRGEVPYERIKGIDGALVDMPSGTASDSLTADVDFLITTYEPRVKPGSITVKAEEGNQGVFVVDTKVKNI